MTSFTEFLVKRDINLLREYVSYANQLITEAEQTGEAPAQLPWWRKWGKQAMKYAAPAVAGLSLLGGIQGKAHAGEKNPTDNKPVSNHMGNSDGGFKWIQGANGSWERVPVKPAGDPLKNFADEGDSDASGKMLQSYKPDPNEGKGTVDPAVVKMVQMLGQNADSVVKTFYKTGSQYKGIVDKAVGVYLDKIEDPKAKKTFATRMANHLLSNQVELSTSMVEKLIDAGLPAHFNDELLDRAQNRNWKNSYISKDLIPKLAAQKVGDFVNQNGLLDKEGNIDQNQADEVASKLVKMYTQALPYDQDGEILDSMLPEIKKMSIFSRMAPQFVKYLTIEKGAVPESEWYRHAINAKQLAVLLKHNDENNTLVSPDAAAWFGKTHTYENLLSDNPEAAKKLYDLASKSRDFDWKKMPEPSGHPGLDSLHGFVNRGDPDARTQAAQDADAMTQKAGEMGKNLYRQGVDLAKQAFGKKPAPVDRETLNRLQTILGNNSTGGR